MMQGGQPLRLTRDNPLLSRPTMSTETHKFELAINCNSDLSERVSELVQDSLSENTKRAYQSDLKHFTEWGGTIPATDMMIADYLADHADTLSPSTLSRRLASISKAHTARGHANPVQSELVKATMRGIKRNRGTAQKQAKPLLKEDLFAVLSSIDNSLKGLRDRALLLIGFAGGFRRSELVSINCNDIERRRQGIVITIRSSKTDQEGKGRQVGIPYGRTRWCPVTSLDEWMSVADIEDGPIFTRIDRHGNLIRQCLSSEAVSLVIKERVNSIGFDPNLYSGHSLRSGFATSAAQAGISSWKIRQQTGHASDVMLARYIRDGELFTDNAAGLLL